jgi:hypothetical protein
MAAGGLAGLLIGVGAGWFLVRRARGDDAGEPATEELDDKALPQL